MKKEFILTVDLNSDETWNEQLINEFVELMDQTYDYNDWKRTACEIIRYLSYEVK